MTPALWIVAVVHLAGALALLAVGWLNQGVNDPLRGVALGAIYAVPAVLALRATRGRPALLLAAGASGLVLALLPVALSLLLAPLALLYLAVGLTRAPRGARGAPAGAGLLAGLIAAGGFLLAFIVHEDPRCVERYADGRTVVRAAPDAGANSGSASGVAAGAPPGSADAPVSGACTSDTVVWWEALIALAGAGVALAVVQSSESSTPVVASPV